MPYAESRERFAETLEIVQRAWTEDTFSLRRQVLPVPRRVRGPKPYQKPHPPIRVAATSMDTFPAIGAQGFDLFAAVRTGTLSELAPNLVAYRAAYAASGRAGQGRRVLARTGLRGRDVRPGCRGLPRQHHGLLPTARRAAGALGAVRRGRGRSSSETCAGAACKRRPSRRCLREKVIVGTPSMVIERLGEIASELQLDGILAELNCGGQVPRGGVTNALRLLCNEVMPAFK